MISRYEGSDRVHGVLTATHGLDGNVLLRGAIVEAKVEELACVGVRGCIRLQS